MALNFSVITPCLNSVRYIEDAIKSVLDQRYGNFEHIIVDGGSTDGTIEILKKYPHLKWISERDNGQSDAMNKGFEMSSGNIVVYLNADDYFLPGAFNAVLPYFQSGHRFLVGKVKVLNEDGSSWINDPKIKFEEMLKWWEPNAYCYNPVGYFYRREIQESIRGFDIQNHHSMDLEFLLEASRRVPLTYINVLLGVFRLFQGTKTATTSGYEYYSMKFEFCDKYLNYLNRKYVNSYKIERKKYLKKAEKREVENKLGKKLSAAMDCKNYHLSMLLGFRLFSLNPLKYSTTLLCNVLKFINNAANR